MATSEVGPPVPESLPSDQQKKILAPDDPWTDERASKIVRSDWAFAESYRVNAHDWRYRNADELFLAWVGQRYWDGTRVPRSSLGQYVVFQQIEAMLPKVVPTVTSYDNMHFYADQPGEDSDVPVQAWRELITNQLVEAKFRYQVMRACKSMMQYGNGVLEVGWEYYDHENVDFDKSVRATAFSQVNHPLAGPMMVPSQLDERFRRKVSKEKKGRPYCRYVPIKELYVDPNHESDVLQEAGYVMRRSYMRAEDLKAMRGQEGFNIPDDYYLSELSKSKSTSNQDVTKLSSELFRYNMWNPAQDYSSDPSQKRIAVVEYTRKNRKIWWLQGADDSRGVIYNQPNRYGFINYFSVPYATVLDRWQALAVSDVAEGEQRLQTAIINGRLDELALSLHPPMVKRRGVTIPAYQLRRRPGVVIEAESPKEDIVQQEIPNVTQQAFVEVQASDLRVQKITGMSDLAGQGVPSAGGNSANRTAAGVNTQASATESRMFFLVGTVEDLLIEPVINAFIQMDRKFLDLKQAATWLKIDPRFQNLDPVKVMNTRVTAECRGSIRMAARQGFLQVFPMLAQTYLNPELLQMLAQQQHKTINAEELMKMLLDAINYSPRNPLLVEMTQEQIQQMQSPPPDQAMKMQLGMAQLQSDQQINHNNLSTKLIVEALKELMRAHTANAEMDDRHIQEMAKLESAERTARAQRAGGAGKDKGGSR